MTAATETTPLSTFDDATRWTPDGAGRWIGRFDETWLQGRTAFGGLVSGAALRAMREVLADDARACRTLTSSFLAPVRADADALLSVEVQREGRSITFVEARITQSDALCATVQGVFGAPRESGITVEPTRWTPDKSHQDGMIFPFIQGVTPNFTRHFNMSWTEGDIPFTSGSQRHLAGWCRLASDGAAPDPAPADVALIGLLDAWPAPVLGMMDRPAPASTVRWSAHLIDPARYVPGAWLGFRSEALTGHDGHVTTRGTLHDAEGHLIAWMEQLVAVFW